MKIQNCLLVKRIITLNMHKRRLLEKFSYLSGFDYFFFHSNICFCHFDMRKSINKHVCDQSFLRYKLVKQLQTRTYSTLHLVS